VVTELRTERLRLVPFASRDAEELLAFFRDAHVRRFMLDGMLVERPWVEEEIAASEARAAAGSFGLFSARAHGGGSLVGITGFRPFHEPPVLELLYAVGPSFTKRGFATEMARAAIAHAFASGAPVIHTTIDEVNVDSLRVVERLGMRRTRERRGELGKMFSFELHPSRGAAQARMPGAS
jgi:[ribosomal protein S5]-alanine N-acetyltransferase